jgi:hypothetical protein
MNTRNSIGNVTWIDTSLHRCTLLDEDVTYPLEPLPNQPRRNRIPRIYQASSLKPWQRALTAATCGMAVLAAILACFPN